MNVIFAGTPVFAARALSAIVDAGFNVLLVLTQPDRPSGRGMKLTPSAVKQVAQQHQIPVAQPISLRLNGKYPEQAQHAREQIESVNADIMVVAAYGLILPQDVLDIPQHGCVNIHASLLPRWRGAAPIHRAIEAGDAETGITLMQMDAGLDTGDMLAMQHIAISTDDTTAVLHDALADMGAQMVVRYLQQLRDGVAPAATPQPTEGVTYAEKIDKAEARLSWIHPAEVIARKVRAFDPAPGYFCEWNGQTVKIWAAKAVPSISKNQQVPGTVLNIDKSGVTVACADQSALCITQMQKAGGKRGSAHQVAESLGLTVGDRLLSPAP